MRFVCTFIGILFVGMTARSQGDDKARVVLQAAIKAHGGEENILKLRIAEVKHTFWFITPAGGKGEVSVVDTYQLPMQFKKVTKGKMDGKDVDLTWAVVNGGEKWWYKEGDGASVLKDEERDIESLYRPYMLLEQLVFLHRDKESKPTFLGDRKVGNRELVGIRYVATNGVPTDLFFDKESGLLAMAEHKRKLPGAAKEGLQVGFVSEYRKVNGTMLFHKQSNTHDGKETAEVRITAVSTFEKLDDKIFAQPK